MNAGMAQRWRAIMEKNIRRCGTILLSREITHNSYMRPPDPLKEGNAEEEWDAGQG